VAGIGPMLVLIKTLHTVVWAFFVACIGGIYWAAAAGRQRLAFALAGVVLLEVLVLVANRMRCPLTPLAARYTASREPNFDIYLPRWIARFNKEIFGTLYLGGVAYAFAAWALAR
jgi:hypothetical protein